MTSRTFLTCKCLLVNVLLRLKIEPQSFLKPMYHCLKVTSHFLGKIGASTQNHAHISKHVGNWHQKLQ